jgi:hypothetical protein
MKFWRNPNNIIAVFTAVAAIAAAAAAVVTLITAKSAERINLQGQLQTQLIQYQTEYANLVGEIGLPSSVSGYKVLTDTQKTRVQIVDSMLVGIVDLMYETKDPRRVAWSGYIVGIPGPLSCGFPLQVYARESETLKVIENARSIASASPCN